MTEERVRLTLRIPARIVHAIEESGEKVSPTIQRIIEEHYLSYVMAAEHIEEEPVRDEPRKPMSEMTMVCEAVQESGIDLFAAQDAGAFTSEQIDKIESIVSSKGILMSRRILVNYLERILE